MEFDDAVRVPIVGDIYHIVGREVGESLTPHLQAYWYFAEAITMRTLKKRLNCSRWHLEKAKGSPMQNKLYCSKEGNFQEFGKLPRPGQRTDIHDAVDLLKQTGSLAQVAENCPVAYVKFYKGLQSLRTTISVQRDWKTEVLWYYGPTGTGKTRKAHEESPGAYWKMGSNHWWDGYDGQEVVIIDDYRKDLCPFAQLLRLFDRYPMKVETKGGTVEFLAKKIIVTSPKHPRDTWDGRTEEDLQQLLRRVKTVAFHDFCLNK